MSNFQTPTNVKLHHAVKQQFVEILQGRFNVRASKVIQVMDSIAKVTLLEITSIFKVNLGEKIFSETLLYPFSRTSADEHKLPQQLNAVIEIPLVRPMKVFNRQINRIYVILPNLTVTL